MTTSEGRRLRQLLDPPVEGGPGHAEVASVLSAQLLTVDQQERIADLGVSEGPAASALALVGGRCLATESVIPSRLIFSFICSRAAIMVRTFDLFGVAVSTFPPPRPSTCNPPPLSPGLRQTPAFLAWTAHTVPHRDEQLVVLLQRSHRLVECRTQGTLARH